MTTNAHTPGPWRENRGGGSSAVVADHHTGHDDIHNVANYGGHLVAESIKWPANARVIAAAPDAVKLLQDAVDLLPRDDDTVAGFLDDAAALLARIHKEDR